MPLADTEGILIHYREDVDTICQVAENIAQQQMGSLLPLLYLSQPPLKKFVYQPEPYRHDQERPIENPEGLTVAGVYEFVRSNFALDRAINPRARFSIRAVWKRDEV